MANKVELSVTVGPMKGKSFSFEEHDTFIFGRMEDCHCCLPNDNQVSRHHFLIEANPPDACIRDFGSLNGTWVNGKKIGAREKGETPEQGQKRKYPDVDLKDGDEVKAGETVMKVKVEQEHRTTGPVMCRRCGKDVGQEIGAGRIGDYICDECRKSIENDPVAQLIRMLAEEGQEEAQDDGSPVIRGYAIKKKLGEGGFGAVYLAEKAQTRTQVAVKVMLSRVAVDSEAREKFQKEIRMMKDLRHPNVVQFLDQGAAGGAFFFIMEYCESGSVADLLCHHGGRLDIAESTPIILQSLGGLAYLHGKGLVHRDLKPQNILLKGQRQNRVAKICDLGFTKNFEQAGFSGMTMTGAVAGTPWFMPREQLTNFKYIKPPSDVWSIAATFYVMLTGAFPRDFPKGKDPMEAILHGRIIPMRERDPGVPKPLAEVLDCALANNAKERYADAGAMLKAIRKVLP
jgi:pSer/pThr/pTyr-binding forkhead associated (FHA) protein